MSKKSNRNSQKPGGDNASFEAISRRLKVLMAAHGIHKQNEFARIIGEEPPKINNYLNANARPALNTAIKIRETFGVTLDWIYLGDLGGLPFTKSQILSEAENKLPEPER